MTNLNKKTMKKDIIDILNKNKKAGYEVINIDLLLDVINVLDKTEVYKINTNDIR